MSKFTLAVITLLLATTTYAADPVGRWETAIGGHDKVAAVHALYREATVEIGPYKGTIKAWHSEGKYRKEEQIATFSAIETFDGVNGTLQQDAGAPVKLEGADLARVRSSAYANANAMFFVFAPEKRHGALTIEGDDTVIMKPEGGIDWRIVLDAATSLPKTMVHDEKGHTITVTFVEYETVDGVKLEKEIHRSMGDPRFDAVIRFTKTVINPPIDASLFAIATK